MLTMTPLAAQSQFGALIDASQNNNTISFEVAKFISENCPLRGAEAAQAMQKHLATMSNAAAQEGHTEASIMQMLHDD